MKKKLIIAAWITSVIGVVFLIFATQNYQNKVAVDEPDVLIQVADENAFLTKAELLERLRRAGLIYNLQQADHLNTVEIEHFIRKMPEVEKVDVFKRLGGKWGIQIKVRQPIARVFNNRGESFYIDMNGVCMKPSSNFTARIIVFSGNIPDKIDTLTIPEIEENKLLKSSHTIDEIFYLAKALHQDKFFTAQIAQVLRNQWGDFILIPRIGNQRIIIGPASSEHSVNEKLRKLKTFYKEGMPYVGWNTYRIINLKYRNQIVCTK